MPTLAGLISEDERRYLEGLRQVSPAAAAGYKAVDIIRRRTRLGTDINDSSFPPYAESTVRRKIRKGQAAAPVTLTDTGQMLDRMKVEGARDKSVDRAFVRFGSARDNRIAGYHIEGTRRMPRRDFFGLTVSELQQVQSTFGVTVNRVRIPDRKVTQTIRFFQ